MSALYGNGVNLTEKVLDLLWTRQNLTVNNIANVDTPGFKSRFLSFENELLNRLGASRQDQRSISRVIDSQHASLHTTANESSRLDGNNVDMDQEQVELVKTAYEYQYMVNSIHNDFKRLLAATKSF